MRNRMLLIDLPDIALTSATGFTELVLTTSTDAALDDPWVETGNPLHVPSRPALGSKTLCAPPSAAVAGLWARTDSKRGDWKAPAGVETGMLGVTRLTLEVGDGEQVQLNPLGVNCRRKLPGFGEALWGSRTLSTKARPKWRYMPVRRTAIMIEQSIAVSIQWAVAQIRQHESNDHRLWSWLRINIESFMSPETAVHPRRH